MKTLAAFVALLLAPLLHAASPLHVEVGKSVIVTVGAAGTAYAIDRSVCDVRLTKPIVTITGRAAGSTQIVVVSGATQQTFAVLVTPAAARASASRPVQPFAGGQAAASWNSGARQVHGQVSVQSGTPQRSSKIDVQTVTGVNETGGRDIATPALSWELRSGKRALTLFDGNVSTSPLTLDGVTVRGLHLDDGTWQLHAGATSFASFQTFLLPTERELVFGISRRIALGDDSVLTPSVYAFPTKSAAGRRGTVASLMHEIHRERLTTRAEVGYSEGRIGGSALFALRAGGRDLDAEALYRPRGFAGAGPAAMHGLFASAAWRERRGRFESDVTGSVIRYDEARNQQSLQSTAGELRYRATGHLQLTGGASWAQYGGAESVRSLTVPVGAQLDFPRGGGGALIRYASNSASNDGGFGFRVNGRISAGRVSASGYFDLQKSAPTLSLLYREQPELMAALEQLGIDATTPDAIARALRDNAALLDLGFVQGVTIELAPRRMQGGVEAAWFGKGDARRQLRLRMLFNRVEGVSRDVETQAIMLSWSQRLTDSTDVQASVSQWRIARTGLDAEVVPSIELGIRHRFDSLPSLPGTGRNGTISGTVFLDEEITGDPRLGTPLSGAEVELDGAVRVTTDANGRYAFPRVGGGQHTVVVRTPALRDAYFTTPSRADVAAGGAVHFGVAVAPARLFGRVLSDAGAGVGGVTLTFTSGNRTLTVTSASDGSFELATAPGEWQFAIEHDTLPAGYSAPEQVISTVRLERDVPAKLTLPLHANRSISGKIAGAANGTVTLEGSGKTVSTDAEGRYVFRSVAAGPATLVATAGGTTWRRELEVPEAPSTLRDVDFGAALAAAAVEQGREVPGLNTFVVQIGAYRVLANANEAAARARHAGVDAQIVASNHLVIVQAGPFISNEAARDTASRLERAGIEAVVLHVR